MLDLLLRLAPGAVVRGTCTSDALDVLHAPAPVFSVYDFIDVVGRPPTHKRKRGAFSRDVWARLTSPQSRFSSAIVGLTVTAAIRASVKVRRSTPTPCMTVPALQTLMHFVELDLQNFLRIKSLKPLSKAACSSCGSAMSNSRQLKRRAYIRADKGSS